ncbi:hypothetical protein [Paenibacillus sp. WC2504]|uniref:hypothetical protein n=1 Tax=Paenibacillus sp. WC2504 TaxID=3461403 RepID=UPI004045218A
MIYISKSQPAPESLAIEKLKTSGAYNKPDVLLRLQADFHNKCYICETKNPTTINVEHFKSHKGNINLLFDWNNLFWACGHCNNLKNKFFDNILNCTSDKDEIENNILYDYYPFPKCIPVIKSIIEDEKHSSTVSLLNAVYSGTTKLKEIEAENIAENLYQEIRKFSNALDKYFEIPESDADQFDLEEKKELKNYIKRQLKSSSAFSAFKRHIIKHHSSLYREFGHLLPQTATANIS